MGSCFASVAVTTKKAAKIDIANSVFSAKYTIGVEISQLAE
jgi:hypothetical protein